MSIFISFKDPDFDLKTPLLLPLMIYVWWAASCSSPPLGRRQTFPTTDNHIRYREHTNTIQVVKI